MISHKRELYGSAGQMGIITGFFLACGALYITVSKQFSKTLSTMGLQGHKSTTQNSIISGARDARDLRFGFV